MIRKQHLGVYCVIFSPENELALIRKKRGPYTGLLDLPGGTIAYGEDLEAALHREVFEETGLKLDQIVLRNAMAFNYEYEEGDAPANLFHIAIIYEGTISQKQPLAPTINDLDAAAADWVPLGKLEEHIVSPLVWNVLARWEHTGF
jgi:8-oxo-dGTP pyrophosphatase MutT (NUDIX family)